MPTLSSSLAQSQLERSQQALEAVETYLRLGGGYPAQAASAEAQAPIRKSLFTKLFSWGAF